MVGALLNLWTNDKLFLSYQAESDMTKIDTELLEKSSIKIRLDITNQHIAYTLQMRLVEAFQHFLEQLVRLLKEFPI